MWENSINSVATGTGFATSLVNRQKGWARRKKRAKSRRKKNETEDEVEYNNRLRYTTEENISR